MSNFSKLINPKFGIINKHGFYPSSLLGTNLYHAYAYTKSNHTDDKFNIGKGVATELQQAQYKAYGEAIERYCASFYDTNNLIKSNFTNSNINKINLKQLNQYKFLYKNNSLLNNQNINWIECINLVSYEKIYLPASMILLPYLANYKLFHQNISTGLACHNNFTKATITGICEILERDAFMLMWRTKKTPTLINIKSMPQNIISLINKYNYIGLNITLYNISYDIEIPIVLAVMQSNSKKFPTNIIAAACKTTWDQAIIAAIEELELSRTHADIIYTKYKTTNIKYEEIKNQTDHMIFWTKHENSKFLDFILNTNKNTSFEKLNSAFNFQNEKVCLDKIIQAIKKQNMHIYVCNLTTIDVQSANLVVVRVVIPEALPMAFGFRHENVGNNRLTKYQKTNKYNPIPHPLP